MASRGVIGLIQDQNMNLSFAGSGLVGANVNGSKVQKRGTAGGRKPLGDLSNAGKPQPSSLQHTLKKQSSKSFTSIEEEMVNDPSKIKNNVTRKRSNSKTADKAQSSRRKALTDISNSEKSRVPEARKTNMGMKLEILGEDSILADVIADEQFLHNHEECIKTQTCAMDKDCFLKTLGLVKDPLKQFASPWISPVSHKPESSTGHYLQFEEMSEVPIVHGSPLWFEEVSSGLDSPNPCQTPSPDRYSHWTKDQESVNFALMDSP